MMPSQAVITIDFAYTLYKTEKTSRWKICKIGQ